MLTWFTILVAHHQNTRWNTRAIEQIGRQPNDRFNQIVTEMGHDSQFLIITHNQRTMEMADRLYGVTMEEPGVSKIVSVRLTA